MGKDKPEYSKVSKPIYLKDLAEDIEDAIDLVPELQGRNFSDATRYCMRKGLEVLGYYVQRERSNRTKR